MMSLPLRLPAFVSMVSGCTIGNMSSGRKIQKDVQIDTLLYIDTLLQTRTHSIMISQQTSVSHTFSVPNYSEMCGLVDVLTVLLLSPTR